MTSFSTWTIAVNGKKPVTYTIGKVIVVMEGMGGYATYRWDLNGEFAVCPNKDGKGDTLLGDLRVMDGGFGTWDTLTYFNGKLASENLRNATDRNGGLYMGMVKPLVDHIHKQTGAHWVTPLHVDGWLRDWVTTGYDPAALSKRLGTVQFSLHTTAEGLRQRYADYLYQTHLQPVLRTPGVKVAEVGGAWYFVADWLHQWAQKTVFLTPHQFKHTHSIPLHLLNGYGLLVLAAYNQRMFGVRRHDA